jgi:hypothetical protein
MRGIVIIGAAALFAGCVSGCVSSPSLEGTRGATSFEALQQMCSTQTVDYGPDAQNVYAAFFDAYVANRRGRLSKEDFCAFQTSIAQRHASDGVSTDPQRRNQWVTFFNDQRAKAISWRSQADPTLRAG